MIKWENTQAYPLPLMTLQKKGYTYNFNMKEDFIECLEKNCELKPEEFEIDEKHRFSRNV